MCAHLPLVHKLIDNNISIPQSKYAAIIGENPSAGARSPQLWNAAFRASSINAVMIPLDVSAENLYSLLDALQADLDFIGGAIAVPYKESVAEWLGLAATAIANVRAAGQLPIIVGGTGMYLQAGLRGIAPVPDVPADLHQHCIDLYRELGGAKFRDALAGYDADIAARLVDSDSQRLVRAMGVAMATDHPLSWWQQQPHEGALLGSVVTIAMMQPRPPLYDRINQRFDHMLMDGAIDEVARLMARQLDPGLPLMKALGVAPITAFLHGDITKDEAAFIAKRDSRRYENVK